MYGAILLQCLTYLNKGLFEMFKWLQVKSNEKVVNFKYSTLGISYLATT